VTRCPSCGAKYGHSILCGVKMLISYEETEALAAKVGKHTSFQSFTMALMGAISDGLEMDDWRSRLDAEFGAHPPRIFHEGA
jgi:hypothetical protein